ncbi:MAG TPA: glycosyltransferase family 1 protein [Chloroflexota bacterium]|nr:glycosyltransferase family 1 protein [Chloroflexota bacterium]
MSTLTRRADIPGATPGAAATGLRVCLVTRQEPGTTGTSRYVESMVRELRAIAGSTLDLVYLPTRPAGVVAKGLAVGRLARLDLSTFLAQYPVALSWPRADVYHLTVQTYASLLFANPPPGAVLVTVHDVIPYLTRHDPGLRSYGHAVHRAFDRLAMRGLRRAERLVADSTWTRDTLVEAVGVDPGRVTVVPLGVDGERYRPGEVPADVRRRYELHEGYRYVVYVGSEDPRKDLPVLWRAFAELYREAPDVRLVKVGAAHVADERRRLRALATELGIEPAVRFLDHVPEGDLPFLYRAASVCVVPSRYEGFGLPVLEAMACGTPVVCARASSLPEVAGDAALLVPPHDPAALAGGLRRLLADEPWRRAQIQRGLARAGQFTWRRTAAAMLAQYQALAGPAEQKI